MNVLDNVDNFFTEVMNIVNQLRTQGEDITDQRVIEKVLRSLPSKFGSIVAYIEKSKDLSQLFVDKLMGFLLSRVS